MEYVYLTCLVIWCAFSAFYCYSYKIEVDKKKYAKRIIAQIRQSYVIEKRFKELYTYEGKAFEERNFLYDYFVEKANVLLNKKLDYSQYRSYENFFSGGTIVWVILLYCVPKSFHTFPTIIISAICAICGIGSFFFYQTYFEHEVSFRDDPKYHIKVENDRSAYWSFNIAPKLKISENQIIKDAEELAKVFY